MVPTQLRNAFASAVSLVQTDSMAPWLKREKIFDMVQAAHLLNDTTGEFESIGSVLSPLAQDTSVQEEVRRSAYLQLGLWYELRNKYDSAAIAYSSLINNFGDSGDSLVASWRLRYATIFHAADTVIDSTFRTNLYDAISAEITRRLDIMPDSTIDSLIRRGDMAQPGNAQPGSLLHVKGLHPNPTSEDIRLEYNLSDHARVECTVTNALGIVLYSSLPQVKRKGEHSLLIDCDQWSAGTYYCIINANGITMTVHFIKY